MEGRRRVVEETLHRINHQPDQHRNRNRHLPQVPRSPRNFGMAGRNFPMSTPNRQRPAKIFRSPAKITAGNRYSRPCFATNVTISTGIWWRRVPSRLSTFAKSVAEEVVEFRDAVDLADCFINVVRDSVEFHEVAVHSDVRRSWIIIPRLTDRTRR